MHRARNLAALAALLLAACGDGASAPPPAGPGEPPPEAVTSWDLVYEERTGLVRRLRRLDLATGQVSDVLPGVNAGQPDVAPDGVTLVAVRHDAADPTVTDIIRAPLAGGAPVALAPHPAPDQAPRWDAAGSRVAFVSARTASLNLFLVNGDGTGLDQLTPDQSENPSTESDVAWAPDGATVVFSTNAGGGRALWLLDLDTRTFSFLTSGGGSASEPDWSPDGKLIVFARTKGATTDLVVHELATGTEWELGLTGTNLQPRWSPDGKWIAFASDRSGTLDLWLVRKDGTGPVRLTTGAAQEESPSWVRAD